MVLQAGRDGWGTETTTTPLNTFTRLVCANRRVSSCSDALRPHTHMHTASHRCEYVTVYSYALYGHFQLNPYCHLPAPPHHTPSRTPQFDTTPDSEFGGLGGALSTGHGGVRQQKRQRNRTQGNGKFQQQRKHGNGSTRQRGTPKRGTGNPRTADISSKVRSVHGLC